MVYLKGEVLKYYEEKRRLEERLKQAKADLWQLIEENRESIDQEFLDYVYWETALSSVELAKVIKADKAMMNLVSKKYVIYETCRHCGVEVERVIKGRSDLARNKGRCSGGTTVCGSCSNRSDDRWKEELRKREAYISHLKTMPYKDYLQTEHWQEFRKKALRKAGYKCQLCNNGGLLNTHHRTYENKGHETYSDVIVLCQDCHGKFHDKTGT